MARHLLPGFEYRRLAKWRDLSTEEETAAVHALVT
jgi:hypothetical protein